MPLNFVGYMISHYCFFLCVHGLKMLLNWKVLLFLEIAGRKVLVFCVLAWKTTDFPSSLEQHCCGYLPVFLLLTDGRQHEVCGLLWRLVVVWIKNGAWVIGFSSLGSETGENKCTSDFSEWLHVPGTSFPWKTDLFVRKQINFSQPSERLYFFFECFPEWVLNGNVKKKIPKEESSNSCQLT